MPVLPASLPDEVVVVEAGEPVVAAGELRGLDVRDRLARKELVDDLHEVRARAGVVDDALDVAAGVGVHREVREGLAVDAVLDDREVELGAVAGGGARTSAWMRSA
jgi:hypothetical protein